MVMTNMIGLFISVPDEIKSVMTDSIDGTIVCILLYCGKTLIVARGYDAYRMSCSENAIYQFHKKGLDSTDMRSKVLKDEKNMFFMHAVLVYDVDKQRGF